IDNNNGHTNLYLPFPQDYTSGIKEFSLKMYIVSGYGAYFSLQQSSVPGLGWMFEIYFDNAGSGSINAGGINAATVSYTPDTWTDIRIKIDLTNDSAELFIDSNSIYTWQWSLGGDGSGYADAIGGAQIAENMAYSGEDFYVDDVLLTSDFGTNATVETFNPDIFVSPNPSNGQFNVMINDLPAGNYQLQFVDVLGRIISNETLNTSGSVIKNFDRGLGDGIYYVRLINGNKATTKKIVVN
ncbi:MAG TPA: T9SS type A sorting domain-containing protein, partial [Chitinophagales bacterium]|nr:T9SS type A sorting domain-containing protein [Chitinophagales bacterium]